MSSEVWVMPLSVTERDNAYVRDSYWVLPMPKMSLVGGGYWPRAPQTWRGRKDQQPHPGYLTITQPASTFIRTKNPFSVSSSHRTILQPLKYIEENDDDVTHHVFPSDALKDLFRLAQKIYASLPRSSTQQSSSRRGILATAGPAAHSSRVENQPAPSPQSYVSTISRILEYSSKIHSCLILVILALA
jgi:hypothetical protein